MELFIGFRVGKRQTIFFHAGSCFTSMPIFGDKNGLIWVNFNCKTTWRKCYKVSKDQTNLTEKQLTAIALAWPFSPVSIWGADNAIVSTTTLTFFFSHREDKILQMELSSPPSFAVETISWINDAVCNSSHVTVRRLAVPMHSSERWGLWFLRLVLPSFNAQRMKSHWNVRCKTNPRKRMLVRVCSVLHANKGQLSPTSSNPYKHFLDMLSASKRDRHV